MPRIVPLQLLKCLKVLLDDNGGILSAGEVKRIAGLMTKYSKKLVSKCIYVQILKCTKTELLGEFMGVGGWSLVYTWLNDGIRAMNWPLVQEILELLLLSPVDVIRLKINSAPKLVKGLCKDGGNEGVRILAKRLVDQWLKIVTDNNALLAAATGAQQPNGMIPQVTCVTPASNGACSTAASTADKDPLADVADVPMEPKYTPTPAQRKASEAGLVYKIIVKDGQQVLAKVAKSVSQPIAGQHADDGNGEGHGSEDEAGSGGADEDESKTVTKRRSSSGVIGDDDDTTNSMDKAERDSESSGEERGHKAKFRTGEGKQLLTEDSSKSGDLDKQRRSEKKDSRSSRDSKDHEKDHKGDKEKEKDKDRKSSSSSSGHRSSSTTHKSSSSSSKSSSSSSSKSKSSSLHRSYSDKHRSDKDRSSSSSKDKDRKEGSSSSSSSKHKSSSSSSSSKSTSSSSKDRHREKDKDKLGASPSSSSASKRDKDREREAQVEKDKDTLAKMTAPSLDKLGKIPKKSKDDSESAEVSKTPTSITIPSKKASMSIEIRRDSEKTKTVKTYKSQFRSHGLTEEAPPPPSRKGLKKPLSSTPGPPGTVIPNSLPSSLKRTSPPPRDTPTEKKAKMDINNVSVSLNEKPGAIKLIAPKKISTLVETNIFSDALSAATGPKKTVKRKRPVKDGPLSPVSPDAPKVAPLKFYQDTLDESKNDDKKSDKERDAERTVKEDDASAERDPSVDDDDDIPLKKVKEVIDQKLKKSSSEGEEEKSDAEDGSKENDVETVYEPKKPGPGCGPNGPPGVLMLHRRKGPKKKLSWRPQEQLEQIRFFELDETERVNVTKTQSSFVDMKNMERFSERDAINLSRRGINHEDNMDIQTVWRKLIEVEDVPIHPYGNQSKQRKVQSDREMTTLRALYFSPEMIPDSPSEAELEPHFSHDIPVIPLEDITGNPDAINDFTSMPWPESKGSPRNDVNDLSGTGGLGGLGGADDMFSTAPPSNSSGGLFNPFLCSFGSAVSNMPPPQHQQMPPPLQQNGPPPGWQGPPPNGVAPMLANSFNGHMQGSPPIMDMKGGPGGHNGPPPQQFMNQFGGPRPYGPGGGGLGPGGPPFGPNGFNNGPNYGPIGPGGPMGPGPLMNGMGPGPMGGPIMNGPGQGGPISARGNNNRNGNNHNGSWRMGGGGNNFHEGSGCGGGGGGGGGGNGWRPAGTGSNRSHNNNNGGNGVCKAFMRGHCRVGKSCKYIHPKNKRI